MLAMILSHNVNGSVAGRPREGRTTDNNTLLAGVAGQLQPVVRCRSQAISNSLEFKPIFKGLHSFHEVSKQRPVMALT